MPFPNGTSELTAEGIDKPVELLAKARAGAGLPADVFVTADFGQEVVLPK